MTDLQTSKRLTNTIFVTQSFATAAQIAIFTLLSIVAVDLSKQESAAGLPSTTMTLVQAAAAYPIGVIMGRFGRRLGLTISYGASVIGALLGILAIMTGSFDMLLLSAGFMGAGRSGAEQSRFAAGDLFPESLRARMIGRIVFAGTIGAVVGPLLVTPGEQLSTLLGLSTISGPWVLGATFYLTAMLVTFLALRPDPMVVGRKMQGKPRKRKNDEPETGRTVLQMLRLPSVQLAVLSMVISQMVMVALMVITPLHMAHHDHNNSAVSLVISAHTLGMFGLSSVTGRLIDRYGRLKMMVAGTVILMLSAIISPLSATMPFLLIGLFLLGLGWNFGYIAGSSLLSDALRGEERSRMQGASDMLVAGCAAFGSLSSGPLYASGGYLMVAGLVFVSSLLLLWLVKLLGNSAIAAIPAQSGGIQ